MRTNADLRKMLSDLRCHAPIRFSHLPRGISGLCIPFFGIFIDKQYKNAPEPYLKAVVYHEVGHWRDLLVWLEVLLVFALFGFAYALHETRDVLFLWLAFSVFAAFYFLGIHKERRADAAARKLMPDFDEFNKSLPG